MIIPLITCSGIICLGIATPRRLDLSVISVVDTFRPQVTIPGTLPKPQDQRRRPLPEGYLAKVNRQRTKSMFSGLNACHRAGQDGGAARIFVVFTRFFARIPAFLGTVMGYYRAQTLVEILLATITGKMPKSADDENRGISMSCGWQATARFPNCCDSEPRCLRTHFLPPN